MRRHGPRAKANALLAPVIALVLVVLAGCGAARLGVGSSGDQAAEDVAHGVAERARVVPNVTEATVTAWAPDGTAW